MHCVVDRDVHQLGDLHDVALENLSEDLGTFYDYKVWSSRQLDHSEDTVAGNLMQSRLFEFRSELRAVISDFHLHFVRVPSDMSNR